LQSIAHDAPDHAQRHQAEAYAAQRVDR
jgi:hypothetical protein